MSNYIKKGGAGLLLKNRTNKGTKRTKKNIRIKKRSKTNRTKKWGNKGSNINRPISKLSAEGLLKRLTRREIVIKEAAPITRFLAFIIDLFIINIIIISPFRKKLDLLIPVKSVSDLSTSVFTAEIYSSVITVFLLIIAYFVIFEFFLQQTPGKMLTGLFIETNEGKEPNLTQCILKNVVFFPILPFIIWWFIDIYFIIRTKQRLTERLLKIRTMERVVLR